MRKVVVHRARTATRPSGDFTLRDALALMASLAGACAFAREFGRAETLSPIALVVSLLVWYVGWGIVLQRGIESRSLPKIFAGLLPIAAALLLCSGALGYRSLVHPPRDYCSRNLKQLALALHSYHDDYGCFPPAYTADASGRPMHSWRVLILPYLGRRDVYERYDFSEPWDGPNNARATRVYLEQFNCPSLIKPRNPCTTDYFVVVGPETLWPGATSVALGQVQDRPDQTILLVESCDLNVHWSQPVDLEWSQMGRTLNAATGPSISSGHPGGALAAFADGHVEFLDDALQEAELRRLLTVEHAARPAGQ